MSKGKEIDYDYSINTDRLRGFNVGADVAPPAKQIGSFGSILGDKWDDGVNDSVRSITATYDDLGVKSVKFQYTYGTYFVEGEDHGPMTKGDKKMEFKLNFKKEYITSVEGHYGQKLPPPGPLRDTIEALEEKYFTKLVFKTNKATYTVPLPVTDISGYQYLVTPFTLKEEGYKIVGFFGIATHRLEQIGVYGKPI